jgi:NAD(P)H-flavin reductase
VVRLNPKGTATPYLFNLLKIGDPISIIAPFGEFYLRDQPVPAVWIAGGSGLSPFLGMLDDLVAGVLPNRPVTLFFGAAKPVDLYYVKELQDLARKHPWFKFIPALSGPEHDPAEVDHGLITEVVERQLSDLSQHEAYLCGGPGMLKACIDILVNKGVAREKIFFDRFG